jgi:hypothetical protein
MTTHTLPFGKHRGKPPGDVPVDYLLWLVRTCKLSSGLRAAIRADLLAREVDEDQLPPEPQAQAPCCRRCGHAALRLAWQPLAGTESSRVIRADCRACGAFVYFAPQTPDNIALADRSEQAPPPRAKEYELRLVALPGPVPPNVRLRQAAKGLLRQHGLRAVSVRELPAGAAQRPQEATNGAEAKDKAVGTGERHRSEINSA